MEIMNIAYVIWIESLISPIIEGQVIQLLKELRGQIKEGKLYLIAFQPVYKFWFKKFTSERANLKRLGAELRKSNIYLSVIPAVYLGRWFPNNWYLLPLIWIQVFPVLCYFSLIMKVRLFHCRSYPPTFPTILVKRLFGAKVIFDPRSPFPEENVVAGRWDINSCTYKVWKLLEKKYLLESDVTIAIANTYTKHFVEIVKDGKFVEIPNNVDLKEFVVNEAFRAAFRSKLGICEEEIVFAYSGSLGNHWNDPRIYADFVVKTRDLNVKHRFLFITKDAAYLKKIFDQHNIVSSEYFVISTERADVPLYLSCADFGLNFMKRPDIRISVKTVEYLAMGLPLIINQNLLGGKELIERYKVGLVIDLNNLNLKELEDFILRKDQQLSLRCKKIALEKFSTKKVAEQYSKVYLSLLGREPYHESS